MLGTELPKGTKAVPTTGEPDRLPAPEPGTNPEREPGNTPEVPEAERPPERKEGSVSDPDRPTPHLSGWEFCHGSTRSPEPPRRSSRQFRFVLLECCLGFPRCLVRNIGTGERPVVLQGG